MTFASPFWLLALAGLAVLVFYVLQSRHRQRDVPFLRLWNGPALSRNARQRVAAPPVALALALAAVLAGVLAAARPHVRISRTMDSKPAPTQKAPQHSSGKVAIARLACRIEPAPQAMVRLRNDSTLMTAKIKLVSGDSSKPGPDDISVEMNIELPPSGTTRDYFLNLPALRRCVTADLIVNDVQPAGNHVSVVRGGSWPVINAAEPAGVLRRLIDVYTARHRPDARSVLVQIATTLDGLEDTQGVICPAANTSAIAAVHVTSVVPDPVTNSVRGWASLEMAVCDMLEPPTAAGWQPVVKADRRILVAVRNLGPVRQAWTCLDSSAWANKPEFVAFWTSLFDWLGHADEEQSAYPAYQMTEKPITSSNIASTDQIALGDRTIDLTDWILVAATACLAAAALTWRANSDAVS